MGEMADEARGPDPRTPPPPAPKDGRPGWRVAPAPDGRGGGGKEPDQPKPPMIGMSWRRFAVILGVLLALNYISVAIFAPPPKRVRIPYSPTFLTQVRDGNVKQIASTGDTIEGDFKTKTKLEDKEASRFNTQVPSFANDAQLSKLLEQKNVTVNAKPPGDRSV